MRSQVIHAYAEIVCKEGCGVVRAGPKSKEYTDPFDFAVFYTLTQDGKAIIKGLVVNPIPWWLRWLIRPKPFTRAYYRACRDAIPHEITFERHNHDTPTS